MSPALPKGFVESLEVRLVAMVRRAKVLEMAYAHVQELSSVTAVGKVRGCGVDVCRGVPVCLY